MLEACLELDKLPPLSEESGPWEATELPGCADKVLPKLCDKVVPDEITDSSLVVGPDGNVVP